MAYIQEDKNLLRTGNTHAIEFFLNKDSYLYYHIYHLSIALWATYWVRHM